VDIRGIAVKEDKEEIATKLCKN